MRENRLSGSEGGGTELNRPSLPLSFVFLNCRARSPIGPLTEQNLYYSLSISENSAKTNVGAALCGRPHEGQPHRVAPTINEFWLALVF